MNRLLPFIGLSAVAGATAIQQPLHDISSSQALINTKPLISSEELQSYITADNLLERAKRLFEIAELGVDEYNHPTRVIGSAGKFSQFHLESNLGGRVLMFTLHRTHCNSRLYICYYCRTWRLLYDIESNIRRCCRQCF